MLHRFRPRLYIARVRSESTRALFRKEFPSPSAPPKLHANLSCRLSRSTRKLRLRPASLRFPVPHGLRTKYLKYSASVVRDSRCRSTAHSEIEPGFRFPNDLSEIEPVHVP